MVITKEHWLPSEEELTVEEVKIGTPALRAGSFQYGKYCEDVNNEFMLCRLEEKDPRKCLGQGKEVTACALKFFRLVKKHCQEEFHQYANCIDKSSVDLNPRYCRKTQAVYDKCILEKLGIERPEFGYFCRAKVHETDRPRPAPFPRKPFDDAPNELPPDYARPDAAHGGRVLWGN